MKKFKRYLITSIIGIAFALLIIFTKNIFKAETTKDVLHILIDAFFAPGVCIAGFGLLVVCSNGGTFDMISYGVMKFFNLFRRDLSKIKYKTFYDYRTTKQESSRPFAYLIVVGVIMILISLILLYFYEQL